MLFYSGLESKNKQNTDNIKALQDRIAQLISHLEKVWFASSIFSSVYDTVNNI
ncbi:hypothetical protein ABFA07_008672 [Porites harrisoni]